MSVRPLVAALVALVGLWLIVRYLPDAVVSGALVFLLQESSHTDPFNSGYLLPVAFLMGHAVLGSALVFSRDRIARWLCPTESKADLTDGSMLAVGVALMGIYFVARGLEHFAVDSVMGERFDPDHHGVRAVVFLALGAALFGGSVVAGDVWRRLSGAIRRERPSTGG